MEGYCNIRACVIVVCALGLSALILNRFLDILKPLGKLKYKDPPNIVLFITDDQDILLQGMNPMPFTRHFFEDGGVTFKNAFVSTPVCCPSRASILTGRYQHNTGVVNNSVEGNCCGGRWRLLMEPHSVATYLHARGYNTFYAGKYLNQYGMESAGGARHVPAGWDWWVGLVGNSRYYNYSLSVNGTQLRHGDNYAEDYLTDVIKRYAVEFLRGRRPGGPPFLLTVAVPAPHSPQTPAPQHAHMFPAARVPRSSNYNILDRNKHRLLLEAPAPLPAALLDTLDDKFRDRWRTLVSVDQLVETITTRLRHLHLIDNTFFMFISDHGYHLGQFALTVDKRQPYEFDLRVPLYMRGPTLPAGRAVLAPVSNVDVAPTILELAAVSPDHAMDGVSLMEPVAAETATIRPAPTARSVAPRTALLVSYNGEYDKSVDPPCAYRGHNVSHCYERFACKCQDSKDNTYRCIREMTSGTDQIVCRFTVGEEFWEAYDLSRDPAQLDNLAAGMSSDERDRWRRRIAAAEQCRGAACRHI